MIKIDTLLFTHMTVIYKTYHNTMQKGAGLIPISADRSRVFLVQGLPTLKWGFPKGRQDPADGEDFRQTAAREAAEEIGLHPTQYTYTDTTIRYSGYTFFEVIVTDSFVPTLQQEEIADGKWFLIHEVEFISRNMYLSLWWNKIRPAAAAAPAVDKKRSRVTFERAPTLLEELDHVSTLLREAEALILSIRKRYLIRMISTS